MDDPKTYIAIVAAVIAFGSLAVAVLTRRDSKASADAAATDAAEANRRADEANDSARRAASAAERVAAVEEARHAAEREAAQNIPPWRFSWRHGDQYALLNDSADRLYDVTHGGEVMLRGDATTNLIDARSAFTFIAVRSFQMGSDVLLVTWRRDPAGDLRTWSSPLPTKGA